MDRYSFGRGGVILYKPVFETRICAGLGSRMKFKTLCYPVFGRNKNTALPSNFDFQLF